jgi:ribulose-phosphate 3-epimerase
MLLVAKNERRENVAAPNNRRWMKVHYLILAVLIVDSFRAGEASSTASASPTTAPVGITSTLLTVDSPWKPKLSPNSTNNSDSDGIYHDENVIPVVIGVDGGTESIRAGCFDAHTGRLVGETHAVPYPTYHPQPGWAEQDPLDWYTNLGHAVRNVVQQIHAKNVIQSNVRYKIVAICIDTTCCSVVALNALGHPLRRSLLWMDQRSAPQTKQIMTKCYKDPAVAVNGNGEGPISAEWMTPKALWIYQNEPSVWQSAHTICEYQDYLNFRLTGRIVASSCNAATRWHWDGVECLSTASNLQHWTQLPGRPHSMYTTLGIPELAAKLPQECLSMGKVIGGLVLEASKHLDLPEGLPVVQGGPDAFVAMIGLGCIRPGQLCLITGSSHLHCVIKSQPLTARGIWGAYRGAPLPHLNFAEGGQSSTGSIIRWIRKQLGEEGTSYQVLDAEAAQVPLGSDGLIALETFQGSRTPITDSFARGAMIGLTLSHTRSHLYRSLLEAVCFGTRACVDALAAADSSSIDEIIMAGGITRSPLWLQMHADVTGKPVVLCENGADAPLLGCAILASIGAGIYENVEDAVGSMVRIQQRIEPNEASMKIYDGLYEQVYRNLLHCIQSTFHVIADHTKGVQRIDSDDQTNTTLHNDDLSRDILNQGNIVVSPSLLACDWSNIRNEVTRCLESNLSRLHIDVFDGVYLDSPNALTFGPQMVAAIRGCCDSYTRSNDRPILDVHVCVDRPVRYVSSMASSGADRFIFQWEVMNGNLTEAIQLARIILDAGMKCGISINPDSDIDPLLPILETGLVDMVDVLAVEPGFGGQEFQPKVLGKIRRLRRWISERNLVIEIMVDGGVNDYTSKDIILAGGTILVSGTFLFKHPLGLDVGAKALHNTR